MIVIGIVGSKGAGKEEVANYIAKKYHGRAHSHSEILDEVLHILRLPLSRENEIRLVALRKTFGPDVLTHALNKKFEAEKSQFQVVTGIRYDSELENIRHFPQNAVIYIDAPIRQRYEWQRRRDKKKDDSEISYEEFEKLEQRETEVNVPALGQRADYMIDNDASLEHLYARVDDIMKKITEKYGNANG